MKLFVGADHNGYELKERIESYLKKRGYNVHDEGNNSQDPEDDFTVYAGRVVNAMKASNDQDPRGILVCGSGQGMVMAANRHKGVRAGLGWSEQAARSIRHDEDANVLALPAEILDSDATWQAIIDTWLATEFAGAERFKRRNRQLDEI